MEVNGRFPRWDLHGVLKVWRAHRGNLRKSGKEAWGAVYCV